MAESYESSYKSDLSKVWSSSSWKSLTSGSRILAECSRHVSHCRQSRHGGMSLCVAWRLQDFACSAKASFIWSQCRGLLGSHAIRPTCPTKLGLDFESGSHFLTEAVLVIASSESITRTKLELWRRRERERICRMNTNLEGKSRNSKWYPLTFYLQFLTFREFENLVIWEKRKQWQRLTIVGGLRWVVLRAAQWLTRRTIKKWGGHIRLWIGKS